MSLPNNVRVKISSEAAGAIVMTQVVVRDMEIDELLEVLLGVAGKDAARVQELLRRGSVVQGASRFRWDSMESGPADIEQAFRRFPDPDPSLPFHSDRCVLVRLSGRRGQMELPREIADKRRFFQRRSFWRTMTELASAGSPEYLGYSYRARADEHRLAITAADLEKALALLKYSGLADQVRRLDVTAVEFQVRRE